jgi:hypothetical protein
MILVGARRFWELQKVDRSTLARNNTAGKRPGLSTCFREKLKASVQFREASLLPATVS